MSLIIYGCTKWRKIELIDDVTQGVCIVQIKMQSVPYPDAYLTPALGRAKKN